MSRDLPLVLDLPIDCTYDILWYTGTGIPGSLLTNTCMRRSRPFLQWKCINERGHVLNQEQSSHGMLQLFDSRISKRAAG
ncbi:hypothetical protein D9613_011822 [Agrocybe pediades]|uniref:Uncharacterized protein n=1 Tax=Agrocybe pediades TaxID=84607 RepID=A0A8H4QLP9_9AGAR|nr:hypothetical protein D9613_011822 [Agrocybe pediades]